MKRCRCPDRAGWIRLSVPSTSGLRDETEAQPNPSVERGALSVPSTSGLRDETARAFATDTL